MSRTERKMTRKKAQETYERAQRQAEEAKRVIDEYGKILEDMDRDEVWECAKKCHLKAEDLIRLIKGKEKENIQVVKEYREAMEKKEEKTDAKI